MSEEIDAEFQSKMKLDNDRINRLPDDNLVAILSFLSPIEAARTSVLSSRWINLWKHTSSLKFDAYIGRAVDTTANRKKLSEVERGKFLNRVNFVLQSHEAVTLNEFIIRYDISGSDKRRYNEYTLRVDEVTQWLEYASAKKVPILELNFSPKYDESLSYPGLTCAFPHEFVTRSTSVDFTPLKALTLKYIDVDGGAIEFFLRNCPLLEELIVHESKELSDVSVCGTSLVLKHLEICYCRDLKCVRVSAPNLVSLTVQKLEELVLENVPMLVELSLPWGFGEISGEKLCNAISCCNLQLEVLNLSVLINPEEGIEFYEFPEMPRLKKLVVGYRDLTEQSADLLPYFIRAAPYIQEFVLKLHSPSISTLKSTMSTGFPHEQLKVVKFCGYRAREIHVRLARYFLENFVNLEKLIIDPRPFFFTEQIPPISSIPLENVRSRSREQLGAEVSERVELVIL
ncbi:hypothetical protein ACP275_02G129700 [Erythranthe tilingii]